MSLIKAKFLYIFNKEYFDYTNSEITLDTFHPQIRFILAINGLMLNKRNSNIRFIWPLQCFALSIVALTFESMTMGHALSIEDPTLFTEAFAYWVVIGVVPVLFFCLLKNPDKIVTLVETMNDDIKIMCKDMGEPYRTKFLEGQLLIWQYGIAWFIFVIAVACMYVLLSIVAVMYHCLFVTQDEESIRPMIFPLWLPEDDPHASPLYETFMFLMYLIILDFCTTFSDSNTNNFKYGANPEVPTKISAADIKSYETSVEQLIIIWIFQAYVYLLFHLWLHAYYLMDLVILGLDNLFNDLDEQVLMLDYDDDRYIECQQELNKRMKRIVTWHNRVFRQVADTLSIFSAVLAYQVVFSSIVMCLMAFYITVQLQQGKFDVCISLLSVGALLQLWIPCYIGSLLRSKGFEIADRCFYSGWHATKLIRFVLKDLTLVMVRSQRPITIHVTCLPVLQLETFSSICSTAYSYFNMLQQKD